MSVVLYNYIRYKYILHKTFITKIEKHRKTNAKEHTCFECAASCQDWALGKGQPP